MRDSILNTSNFFHVTQGLVPDIMHDVLEGSAPYEVKELLKYLVTERMVTLEDVNSQIEHFLYTPPDAINKLTSIPVSTFNSSDHSLKQKGMSLSTFNCCLWTQTTIIFLISCTDVVPLQASTSNDWREGS